MNKKQFINNHITKGIRLDHLSSRQLDYKFHEYLLYLILIKYTFDFSILGLPEDISIVSNPKKHNYNIYNRTHVTLNYEIYKLYDCGYFESEAKFISFIKKIIRLYNKNISIKILSAKIRNLRLKYQKENYL